MKDDDAVKTVGNRDSSDTIEINANQAVQVTQSAPISCDNGHPSGLNSQVQANADTSNSNCSGPASKEANVKSASSHGSAKLLSDESDSVKLPKMTKTVILELPNASKNKKQASEPSQSKKSRFSLKQFFRSRGSNSEKHRQELIKQIKLLLMDAHISGRPGARSEHISFQVNSGRISGKIVPAMQGIDIRLPDFSSWETPRLESYLQKLENDRKSRLTKADASSSKRAKLIQDLKLLFIENHIGWGEDALQFYEVNVTMPEFSAWSTENLEAYHRVMMDAKIRWERHEPKASEAYHKDLWRLCELFYLRTRGVDPSKCFTMDAGLIAKCVKTMSSGNMGEAESLYDKEIRLFYGVPQFEVWSNYDLAKYLVRIEQLLRVQEKQHSGKMPKESMSAHGRSHTLQLEASYEGCRIKTGRRPSLTEAFQELELRIELRKHGKLSSACTQTAVNSTSSEKTETKQAVSNAPRASVSAMPAVDPRSSVSAIPAVDPRSSVSAIPAVDPRSSVNAIPAVDPRSSVSAIPAVNPRSSAYDVISTCPTEECPQPQANEMPGTSASCISSRGTTDSRPVLQAVVLADFGSSEHHFEQEESACTDNMLSWQALSHSKLLAVSSSQHAEAQEQRRHAEPPFEKLAATLKTVSSSDMHTRATPSVSSSDTLRMEMPNSSTLPSVSDNQKKKQREMRKAGKKSKHKRHTDGMPINEDGFPIVMTGKEARALKAERQAEKIKARRSGSLEIEEALNKAGREEEAPTCQLSFSDDILAIFEAEADALGIESLDESFKKPSKKLDTHISLDRLPLHLHEQEQKGSEIYAIPEPKHAPSEHPDDANISHALILQFVEDVQTWIEDDSPLDPRISDYRRTIFNAMREFVRFFDGKDRFMSARVCAESIRILKELPFLSVSHPDLPRDMTGALFSVLDLMTGWADTLKADESAMRLPLIQVWRARFGYQMSDDQVYERALTALGCRAHADRYHPMFWRYAFDMDPSQFDYRRFVSCMEGLLRWHGMQVPELPQCDVNVPIETWCDSWSRSVSAMGLVLSEYHYNPAFAGSRRYYFLTPYERIDTLRKLFVACKQNAHLRVWV